MSPSFHTGLVMLGLLSALDLTLPLLTDGQTPPMSVALVAAALGLASLALVISAWRGARRAVLPLAVLRAMSAASAVPVFFEPVPTAVITATAVGIAATALGIVLILSGSRRIVREAAR